MPAALQTRSFAGSIPFTLSHSFLPAGHDALWCAETFPFRKEFLVVLDEADGAAANAIDFKRDPEAARARINRRSLSSYGYLRR